MNEVHFEGKIAQKAIIVKENKVLLLRDPRESEEIWEIPGGRLNIDEDPKVGLQRELYEELGVQCDIHEVVYLAQFIQGNEKKRACVIVYRATLRDENALLLLDEREVLEIKWVSFEELVDLKLFPEYTAALQIFFKSHSV